MLAATVCAAIRQVFRHFSRHAPMFLGYALLATGCPKPLMVNRPYAAPTAASLAGLLTARQQLVTSLNARVRATSWLGGDRVRATVLMLADRRGSLRFEAEVSLQGTVAILATDGIRFAFLDTTKNELRRGPACPANVASLIRIPLGPHDVAAVLLGDVLLPADLDLSQAAVEWDASHAADVLAVRRNDGWLRILIQGGGGVAGAPTAPPLRIRGATAVGPEGQTRWRLGFEDFTDVPATAAGAADSVSLPQTIRFAEGDGSFNEGVEIKFKERSLNETAPPDVFTLSPPVGTKITDVGCPGTPPP